MKIKTEMKRGEVALIPIFSLYLSIGGIENRPHLFTTNSGRLELHHRRKHRVVTPLSSNAINRGSRSVSDGDRALPASGGTYGSRRTPSLQTLSPGLSPSFSKAFPTQSKQEKGGSGNILRTALRVINAFEVKSGARVAPLRCSILRNRHEHHSKPWPHLSNTKLTKGLTKLTILVKPVVFLSV